MSADYYYQMCHEHMGQEVEIRDRHGKVYTGTIEKVDHENVYIRPPAPPPGHGHGPGVFFFPLVVAGLIAIPLIAIAAFAPRRRYRY